MSEEVSGDESGDLFFPGSELGLEVSAGEELALFVLSVVSFGDALL